MTDTLAPTPTPFVRDNQHPMSILGLELDHMMSIDEALAELNVLDEVIWLEDMRTANTGLDVPAHYAVVSDKFNVMGVHGTRYEVMDRRDILTIAYDIIGLDPDGRHLHAIGNIGDRGEKFFAYVKDHDLVIDPNGVADRIERGYLIATSYDGTLKSTIGRTAIRLACSNMLKMALGGLEDGISVMHRHNAEGRIRAQAVEKYAGAYDREMVLKAEKMLRAPGGTALNRILNHFYPPKGLEGAAETRRTQARNWIGWLYDGAGNISANSVGENGWAAYNAYVEYLDFHHEVRGGDKGFKRAERAAFPGDVQKKKNKAAELVLAGVN